MRQPSPGLSRVRLGSRRDEDTKAISAATNSRLESEAFVLFTSQIESIIYIQRSAPGLSQDFRSANMGRFMLWSDWRQSDVKRWGQCCLLQIRTLAQKEQCLDVRISISSLSHASRQVHKQAKRQDKAAHRLRQWSMTISQGMTAPAVRKDDPHLAVFVLNKRWGKADRIDSRVGGKCTVRYVCTGFAYFHFSWFNTFIDNLYIS